jgi:pantetheine-phosphate adenylyltransferase
MTYRKIILGGTFDRLHAGHGAFLDTAFKSAEKVIIGLTTPSVLKKIVRQNSIWPYEERKKAVEDFAKKYGKDFEIIPIDDIFGPSTEMGDLDAILATYETRHTCERINQIRKRKRLKPLEIVNVPYVYSEDCRIISSSRIRNNEIDRKGQVLVDYSITESLREDLRVPKSKIFEGDNSLVTKDMISYIEEKEFDRVICVGDEVSYDLLQNEYKPRNVIVDGKVGRTPIDYLDKIVERYSNKFYLTNNPGTIAKEAWRTLRDAFKQESAVLVDGEEDLLAIPTILLTDINTSIIYGQPGRGKVIIEVDDERKEIWRKRLADFSTIHR